MVEKRDFVYTGKAQVPVVHELQDPNAVTINEQYFALKFYATQQSTDELNPEDIVNAGTYWVAAYGITELYQGETPRVQFNIIRKNLADADIIVEGVSDQTYTGSAITFNPLTVKYGDLTLTPDKDYIVSYENNYEVGENDATVTITTPPSDENGNYYGKKEVTFSILPKSIASESITVSVTKNPDYIKAFVVPTLEVKDGETILVEGTDYELVNETYKNAGDAVVTIKGKGNYDPESSREQAFKIIERNFALGVIKLTYTAEFEYNGEIQNPTDYVVTDTGIEGSPVLTAGTDYKVEYQLENGTWAAEADSKNAGTYQIRVTGIGNYRYSKPYTKPNEEPKKLEYTINGKKITITANDLTVGYGTAVKPTATFSENATDADIEAIGTITFKYNTVDDAANATATAPTAIGTYYIFPEANDAPENYQIIPKSGVLNITKATLYLVVNDASINYGETPSFSLEVEDGLAGQTFNARNLSATPTYVIDGEVDSRGYYPVKRDAEDNVVAYKVSVKETNLVYDETYNVIVKPGKLTVNPRNISLVEYFRWNIETDALDYNGEEQTPTTLTVTYQISRRPNVTITLDPSEYEISASNNKNATTNALVTITGKGNFEGSHTETFTINRVPLTITAKDATVAYNKLATYTFEYEVDGLKGEDKIEDLGTVVVNNTSTNAVGLHEDALRPSGLGARTTNYTVSYVRGDLTVTPAEAIVKATDATFKYGEDIAFEWEYVSGLVADEEAYAKSLITGDAVYTVIGEDNKEYDYKNEYVPAGEYTVKVSGLTATDYTVKDNELGKLTITKKPIVVTACDQNVGQGVAPVLDVYYEETEDHIQTVIIPEDALVGDDELVLALECTATAVGENADAIKITFDAEAKPNCNYEITTVSGTLTVAGAEYIELARAAEWDNSALLADYAGQKVSSVKIKGDFLKKDWWYTLTLPFATTAMDIADAFGYVVVDVPDLTNKDPKKVAFELAKSQEIPANTMILIKMYRDRDLNSKPAVFEFEEETEIVYNPRYVEDAAHNKYYTLYANKALDPITDANTWYLYENSAQDPKNNIFYRTGARADHNLGPWNVASLGGYFESASADPDAVRVYVQDEDGTITAINAMEINPQAVGEGWYTIDGMKLDAAPTQKGVYINNGKKVVVK